MHFQNVFWVLEGLLVGHWYMAKVGSNPLILASKEAPHPNLPKFWVIQNKAGVTLKGSFISINLALRATTTTMMASSRRNPMTPPVIFFHLSIGSEMLERGFLRVCLFTGNLHKIFIKYVKSCWWNVRHSSAPHQEWARLELRVRQPPLETVRLASPSIYAKLEMVQKNQKWYPEFLGGNLSERK